MRLLGDAMRLRILLVSRYGEHSVGAIAEAAAPSQANTSKHRAARRPLVGRAPR